MKSISSLVTIFLLAFILNSNAQYIDIIPGGETRTSIADNDFRGFEFNNTLAGIRTFNVTAEGENYLKLKVDKYSRTQETGRPELPVKSELIEIPFGAKIEVEVVSTVYHDLSLSELGYDAMVFPSQPPVPKSGQVPPFVIDEEAYNTNSFYPGTIVSVSRLGVLRGLNIGRMEAVTVQYNPVKGILRVYEEIVARVKFTGADLSLTASQKKKVETPYYRSIARSLLNYIPLNSRDTLTTYPVKYVIISDPVFESQLQPFIEWKTRKGFDVVEAYTDDPSVGNTKPQIKSYIQDIYDNSDLPPSFVLFVGDIEQVPTWTGNAAGHATDLFYCEFTGDYFPEIYYGRLSAKTADHLQPQIDKILEYEQYTMPDPTYLNEVVMVAGMDGSHGHDWANGQINYGTENYFNETNGIISHTYLYPESGGNSANIIQNISDGVTYGNYTAHCSPNGWADPSFTIGDIPTLENEHKYGVLVGNCCSSSEYQQTECFGEEIVRAEDKGAVGYIGASNSTYWDEDYYWGVGVGTISEDPPSYEETTLGMYDRMWHTHDEPFEDWYTTTDQMIYAGNLAVTEGAPGMAEYYWEAYNILGDPSLMIYLSEPSPITVDHMPILILNTTSFTVNTDPYAYVAISKDGVLHGAALANAEGVAEVPLIPIVTPGLADVVVTKQNGQPYIGTVLAANPDGPFVLLNDHVEIELQGNNNSKVDCGEIIAVETEFKNWGNSDAINLQAVLQTSDPFVTLTDTIEYCGLIPSQDSVRLENAFSFIVDDMVPDNYEIPFDIFMTDDSGEEWNSEFTVKASAPMFSFDEIIVDDASGNNNGRLDPGEEADILLVCSNQGHTAAPATRATLAAHSGFINIENPVEELGHLGLFGNKTAAFNVSVDENAPVGILAEMIFNLTSGNISHEKIRPMRIGMVCEDFETGDLSMFNWQQDGNANWDISGSFPFEGFYSLKSGDIGNSESTEIYLQYEVMQPDSITFFRKVSSEEGFDKLKFYINNTLMAEWSGTSAGWRRASFPVGSGMKTFRWVYEKDGGWTSGSDCAWIDYIVFPTPVKTTLYAGEDATACEDNGYQILGDATDYDDYLWETSGTGVFNSITTLTPVYTPSETDISNGGVTVTLTVWGTNGIEYTDEMELAIELMPEAPGMPTGPDYVDLSDVYISGYSVEGMPGITDYNWLVEPSEAGIFTADGNTGTIIWDRNFAGEATIHAEAQNTCGNGPASDGLVVTVENNLVGTPEPIVRKDRITVYPNPTQGKFNIEMGHLSEGKVTLELVNLTGKTVIRKLLQNSGESIVFNGSGLPSGVYVLVARTEKWVETKKIIIQ